MAVVGLGVVAADGRGRDDFSRCLFSGQSRIRDPQPGHRRAAAESVLLPLDGLRFPPKDLAQARPQQLLVLQAACEALKESGPLAADRTGVLVGMECDPEVTRFGMRWQAAKLAEHEGRPHDPGELQRIKDAFAPPFEPATVVGAWPTWPLTGSITGSASRDRGGPWPRGNNRGWKPSVWRFVPWARVSWMPSWSGRPTCPAIPFTSRHWPTFRDRAGSLRGCGGDGRPEAAGRCPP